MPSAFDAYLRAHIDWVADYEGFSTGPVTVYVSRALNPTEKSALDALVAAWVNPAKFLIYDRVEPLPMYTNLVTDAQSPTLVDGKKVLQSFIMTNRNSEDNVMDALKTIVEYVCPDPVAFAADPVARDITLELYDITRNVSISTLVIALGDIQSAWNALNTSDATATWRSAMFMGLHTKTTNYDCIWQIRAAASTPSTFTFRLCGLQQIFYSVEIPQ